MSNAEVLNWKLQFKARFKTFPKKGYLTYEYNPFYNYRLSNTKIKFKNKLLSLEEFWNDYHKDGTYPEDLYPVSEEGTYKTDEEAIEAFRKDFIKGKGKFTSKNFFTTYFNISSTPEVLFKGLLTNFETSELKFDFNHPVEILPQWSYDNSVNLIINDGLNPPRLINSRFSPTSKNLYEVNDRKGNNDTNIYDEGVQFDIDTSLYKKINNIPKLEFKGVSYGGNLKIGNYHFYFKYVDEDGNESDFFAESGLVSVFIGNTIDSITTGVRDENSHKQIRFQLTNLDIAYNKINVYYSRATSDINENSITVVNLIELKYTIDNFGTSNIVVTGFENVTEKTVEDLNQRYQIYGSAESLATALNMLFLANTSKPNIDYNDFLDCALRFIPTVDTDEIYNNDLIKNDYSGSIKNTYYDPDYIYNKVGYWDDEIYRFGIVFILKDNTLTDVFNVRGLDLSNFVSGKEVEKNTFIVDKNRKYIEYDDTTFYVTKDTLGSLDNVKGVVYIPQKSYNESSSYTNNPSYVIGIKFQVPSYVIDYLRDTLGVTGWFFVRLKRIPTTLCLAYTIGIDPQSHTPVLPTAEYDSKEHTQGFVALSFLDLDTRYLQSDGNHSYEFTIKGTSNPCAAICPEYDINSPYFNSLFTGLEFLAYCSKNSIPTYNSAIKHYVPNKVDTDTLNGRTIKILGVEDNVKLVTIQDNMFSARAGEAEEAFRYAYISLKNKSTKATNLLRGSYGPYLGVTGLDTPGQYITIKIPDYSVSNLSEYFKIRFNDKCPFYPITDKYSMSDYEEYFQYYDNKEDTLLYYITAYRGDCYICQFTHRINRNFQDPSSPTNDDIVDPKCWVDNYEVTDGVVNKEKFDDINLGDVNAVELGLWITLIVRASSNLNIRTLDDSIPDEVSLFGHARGFYPYQAMSTAGTYKIQEALVHNKGFGTSLSSKYNFEVADVPWIKNEFSNRIAYSNIQVQDAFQNGWRTFMGTHFRDYPKTYGSITKILELRGSLICVFEHGIGLIPVNERAVAGEGSGGTIYINTSNVLPENPKIISDTFGSQWRDSVIKTPLAVYGVDTVGKKIWRTNGDTFECISNFKVQEFLNNNISLTERETTPIIGIRNVKTHYNKFKNDVMFTFYDNLEGFEERVWNLCFNENKQKWITFYSWVPSYSENIYNQYFSFDRTTSKWISKLGISRENNTFTGSIYLSNNIIDNYDGKSDSEIGELLVSDVDSENVTYNIERDHFGNYDKVYINTAVGSDKKIHHSLWIKSGVTNTQTIYLLNVSATVTENGVNTTHKSQLAITTKSNLSALTTGFWKHGLAGIIDDVDKPKPCMWYGKQHPFEFEFVISNDTQYHKIFDNLQIISNNAEPESFHYEIVGDSYEFAKDKENMYIRQEATKEFFQYNNCDILYDKDYYKLNSEHRKIEDTNYYDKSTLFPLYYQRRDTFNEIEDYYDGIDGKSSGKDYSALAGAEIVRYDTLGEYRIWNHAKGVDMTKNGRLRGNMQYKEDKWYIQINPLNIVQKNEPAWDDVKYDITQLSELNLDNIIPIEIGQQPIPAEVINWTEGRGTRIPPNSETRAIVQWKWEESQMKEAKIKDKWMKVRIRYTGNKLAVITAVKTLYSISFA